MQKNLSPLGLAVLCALQPRFAAAQTMARPPLAITAADLGRLFDGSAPSAAAATPVQTGQGDARRRIEEALNYEYGISGLTPEDVTQATPKEKIAMLKTLIAAAGRNNGGGESGDPYAVPREQAVYKILDSAQDAADFDYLYYRLDPRGLAQAADFRRLKSMVAAQRATAVPGDWEGFGRYVDTVAETKSSGKNQIQFLIDGEGAIAPIKAAYLRAFATAEREIRIANPYFVDSDIVAVLAAAARRGVKVQVIVPEDNDVRIVQRASRAFYPDLIAAGVEIYEYQGRMAHEKVCTIDGIGVTAGSSNMDARSFSNNDELNLIMADRALAAYVNEHLFDKDLQRSKRITSYTPTPRERIDRALLEEML